MSCDVSECQCINIEETDENLPPLICPINVSNWITRKRSCEDRFYC